MTTQTGTATSQVPLAQLQAIAALAFNNYQQGRLKEAETLFRGLQVLDRTGYLSYAGVGAVALAQPTLSAKDRFLALTARSSRRT